MSDQELLAELPTVASTIPESTTEETIPALHVQSDTDELKEYFRTFSTRQSAIEQMNKNKVKEKGVQKFVYNNKTYGLSLGRKVINRLASDGEFKKDTPKLQAKTLTFEFGNPPIPTEPETPPPTTPQETTTTEQQPALNILEETSPTTQTAPPQASPIIEEEQKEYVPPRPEVVQSWTNILSAGFAMAPPLIADTPEDLEKLNKIWILPEDKMKQLGYDFANVTKASFTPEQTSAVGILCTVIGCVVASKSEIQKKLGFGGKKQ